MPTGTETETLLTPTTGPTFEPATDAAIQTAAIQTAASGR